MSHHLCVPNALGASRPFVHVDFQLACFPRAFLAERLGRVVKRQRPVAFVLPLGGSSTAGAVTIFVFVPDMESSLKMLLQSFRRVGVDRAGAFTSSL
jgi:hypothetical protein